MGGKISLPLIVFGLMALGIVLITAYVAIYDIRKQTLEKLFRIIREKIMKNEPAKEEADAAVRILYTNQLEVATPIYLFVNKDEMTDLLVISLLRAALRYINLKIESELDGSGVTNMPAEERLSLGKMLQAKKTIESTIDFTRLHRIKKIDILLMECSNAYSAYLYLLKENNKKLPKMKPLFHIAQRTPKDPCRLLFPAGAR